METMSEIFRCPMCKGSLVRNALVFQCAPCAKKYPIVDGIPDFYIAQSGHDFDSDPNIIWLEQEIVEARDTIYRLCARQLKGMAFCMGEIGRRTCAGTRLLEVGMGTGHFTRWLAEVSAPGTEIYAFDFSWPIIGKAKANTAGLPGLRLFRANAREPLPFGANVFDILLIRLAPLGARGVPNVQAAFEWLKPGGWYFEAGWEQERYETPPTDWALQHGYETAEHHVWHYPRLQTEEEYLAWRVEGKRIQEMMGTGVVKNDAQAVCFDAGDHRGSQQRFLKITQENVFIAQKPV
jgi:SAM-dependent methyltransferase